MRDVLVLEAPTCARAATALEEQEYGAAPGPTLPPAPERTERAAYALAGESTRLCKHFGGRPAPHVDFIESAPVRVACKCFPRILRIPLHISPAIEVART